MQKGKGPIKRQKRKDYNQKNSVIIQKQISAQSPKTTVLSYKNPSLNTVQTYISQCMCNTQIAKSI